MSTVMADIREPLDNLAFALRALHDGIAPLADASVEIDKLHERLLVAIEKLSHLASEESWDGLRWIDVKPRSVRLNLTPLDVADTLHSLFSNAHQAWIF